MNAITQFFLHALTQKSPESDSARVFSPLAAPAVGGAFSGIQTAVEGQNRVSEKAVEVRKHLITALLAALRTSGAPEERSRFINLIQEQLEKVDVETERARAFNRNAILLLVGFAGLVLLAAGVPTASQSLVTRLGSWLSALVM